jgi:hypothetical protein
VDLRPETPDVSAAREAANAAEIVKAAQRWDEVERRAAEVKQIEQMRGLEQLVPVDSDELRRAQELVQEVQRMAPRRAAEINRIADQHRTEASVRRRGRQPPPERRAQAAQAPAVVSEAPVDAPRQIRRVKSVPVAQSVDTVKSRPRVQRPAEQVGPAASPLSRHEGIAARQGREARDEAIRFLRMAGLAGDIEELVELEKRLQRRNERDLQHAAFCSRMILSSVADRVFPACAKPWRDLHGEERPVGPEEVGNRLSAFLDQYLRLEPAIRAAFQGELDGLKRWVGRGPHGVHTAAEADRCYMRLLSVLAGIAEAFDVAIVPVQAPRLARTV